MEQLTTIWERVRISVKTKGLWAPASQVSKKSNVPTHTIAKTQVRCHGPDEEIQTRPSRCKWFALPGEIQNPAQHTAQALEIAVCCDGTLSNENQMDSNYVRITARNTMNSHLCAIGRSQRITLVRSLCGSDASY